MDTTIAHASAVADLLWPDFVEEGGAVFLRAGRLAAATPLSKFPHLLDAECFVNHVHILDEFEHNAALDEDPFWNPKHVDFMKAIALAGVVAETWATRLARDFPDQSFAIFATRDDNPIVRFHKIRPDQALYLRPDEIERLDDGSALMIRVEQGRVTQRLGHLASA
jgi:hypothetical protein